jgi:poly-gamma-glutamate synthesis protein (capsule biosynthesis protein)
MRRAREIIFTLPLLIPLLAACTATPQSQNSGYPSAPTSLVPSPTLQAISDTDIPSIPTPEKIEPSPPVITDTPTPNNQVWIAPYLPEALQRTIHTDLEGLGAVKFTTQIDEADIHVQLSDQNVYAEWVYALVVPFPSLIDASSIKDILDAWQGEPSAKYLHQPLLMDEITHAIFSQIWGNPHPDSFSVLPENNLLDYAWENQPAWALIPFEDIEPRWKVLEVTGQSPIRKDFDPLNYPLIVSFGITGSLDDLVKDEIDYGRIPISNRSGEKLTTLSLTGVTALVRGTALTMERRGITYPAQDIGEILRTSDLTHINNEVPFTPECPFPELYPSSLVFCSAPEYIELLEELGTDIVELSGDHFGDYGPEAMLYTLEMYDQRGWQFYAGGENAANAREPVLINHNGNRIALLGCNIGCDIKTEISCKALAQGDRPGGATCDFNWLDGEIRELSEQGYLVVVTIQHKEYFTYTPQPDLIRDFGRAAQSGAAIISGSQAHQPHGMAFQIGAFIHYGLGNLFFDQYNYCADNACNYGFIDRHIFYDGHHINTELITIRFVDMARPRLMTPEERSRFLEIIFQASGW